MRTAIKLGEFFLAHAALAFRLLATCSGENATEHVEKVLRVMNKPVVKRREIHQRSKGRFPTIAQLVPVLSTLVEMGLLREAWIGQCPLARPVVCGRFSAVGLLRYQEYLCRLFNTPRPASFDS